MRSLLSQFQTPTVPRRASRFFRVWLPTGLPRLADHSAYFGLATFYFRQPFQPSTENNLNSRPRDVNAILAAILNICACYCGKQGRFSESQQKHVGEPIPCLDSWRHVAHCCSSRTSEDVESRCLRGWWLTRKSWSLRYWSGDRWLRKWHHQNPEVDRAPRQ